MVNTKTAREILKESEIENKIKECFKQCAAGRQQLRKCVVDAMNVGLTGSVAFVVVLFLLLHFGLFNLG